MGRKRVKGTAVKDEDYKLAIRRCEISRLYVQGNPIAVIAKKIGLSHASISLELKRLEEYWLKRTQTNIEEAKAHELMQIEELQKVAWEEWLKSQRNAESTKLVTRRILRKSEKISDNVQTHLDKLRTSTRGMGKILNDVLEPVEETEEKTSKGQCGDARYLQIVQWCRTTIMKIRGLVREDNIINQTNNHITFNFDTLYNNQEPVSDMIEDKLNEELRRVTVEPINNRE